MGPKKGEEKTLKEIDSSLYTREAVAFDDKIVELQEESQKGRIINLETLFPVWDDESIKIEDFSGWSDDSPPDETRYPWYIKAHEYKSLGSLLSPKSLENDEPPVKGKYLSLVLALGNS